MKPNLKLHSAGTEVEEMQTLLKKLEYPVTPDGFFGPRTHAAVVLFQEKSGLAKDGVVGPRTWEALEKAVHDATIGTSATPKAGWDVVPEVGEFNIGPDHWLVGVKRETLPGGSSMPNPRFLVEHFTSGASAKSSIDFWRTPAAKVASAHIVIDRDGTVYQCRPFNRTCGHAGTSSWKGVDGLNSCSIGIEIANAGDDVALAKRWTKLPLVSAKHKNESAVKQWEAYPDAQMVSVIGVSKAVVKHYGLEDVVGHEDIAPKRKIDPGPAFPMGDVRMVCGLPPKVTA